MCHIAVIIMGFLVMYMAYYMVTIRERVDKINNLTEKGNGDK